MSQDKPTARPDLDETEPGEEHVDEPRPAAETWEAVAECPPVSTYNPDHWPKR